jgi:hypothetical protein
LLDVYQDVTEKILKSMIDTICMRTLPGYPGSYPLEGHAIHSHGSIDLQSSDENLNLANSEDKGE